ncbi:MAG: hypothetical protein R6X02_00895 [Enhygromyxa sp.]
MANSDVEVLSRSFRSRIALFALLCTAALGLALWTGTRKGGVGEPEDRRRIMVVSAGGEINYDAVLGQAGFSIEVDELDGWVAAARAADLDSEGSEVARVLELADLRGFALVVFERPSELDFGGLELEPAIDTIDELAERDYVALSVGDYAFPHRLSVDDPGDPPFVRLPGYGALQAVFRQDLIHAREAPERPTLAELQFEAAIRVGQEMFERPPGFEAAVAFETAVVEATLDDGSGARMLLPALSTGTPIPTPDGGILLFHHELSIYSDNARTLEIEAPAQMQISWVGPAALARGLESGEFELEPCISLRGGALEMAERPRIEAAVDGSAVAIGSAEGAVVWRKAEAPGCSWAPVAEIDRLEGIVLAPRSRTADPEIEIESRSVAARIELAEASSRVLVWAHADDDGDEEGEGEGEGEGAAGEGVALEPQVVIEQSGRRFASLVFVDDRHLALSSTKIASESPEDRVYLLDRTRPGVYLSLPVESFAAGRRLREVFTLASASETAGPELLVSAQNRRGRIELIRVRVSAEAWRRFVEEPPAELEPGGRGTMIRLDREQLEAELLFDPASVLGLSVGAGAVLASLGEGPLPGELILLDLATGDRRALTDNRVRDYLPRVAADGSHATFVSLMRVNFSTTPFSVPRVLALTSNQ